MADPEARTLALALQQLRTARELTQEELAERSGVSVRTISDIERGISRAPHRDTLKLLADALALSEDEAALLRPARYTQPANAVRLAANMVATGPESSGALLGRAEEYRAIQRALSSGASQLVTLTGPAGIGKTRLALELARTFPADFPALAESACVVDLAPVADPNYVPATLAHVLNIREQAGQPLSETLMTRLADRPILLLFDNFEHLLAASSFLGLLLARCPHALLLVTSRHPLNIPGEQVYPIPPLATPDPRDSAPPDLILRAPATALFIERARAAQPDFSVTPATARTIAKICARLGGIPLAIELAAAWVTRLSPQAILAQITTMTGRNFLSMLTRRSAAGPRRQRSMLDAVAWSYHLLDAHEQVFFHRLGVFVGGWSVEAAEAICGPLQGEQSADELLARLAHHSLITVADGNADSLDETARFTMHAIIASYAQTLLDERRERVTLARRHAEYFADLVERLEQGLTGARQQQSLAQLVAEYENIRAALRWTREQHELDLGLRLAGALWWFWETRGYTTEGREWVEGMLRLAETAGVSARDENIARALYCATILATDRHDYAHAEHYAHAFLRTSDQPDKRARALLALGNLAKFKGDAAQAEAFYSDGLAALRTLNDLRGMLVALNNLSTLAIERGDLDQALPLIEESLALKRERGDRRGVAVSLMNLGEAQKLQGEAAAAQQTLEEGLRIFQELADQQGIAMAWNNLGELAEAQGDDAQAAVHFEESLRCYRQMEDKPGEAQTLLHLGKTLTRLHDESLAERYLRESATLFESLDQTAELIESLVAQARLAWAAGRTDVTKRLLGDVREWLGRVRDGSASLPQTVHAEYQRLLAETGLSSRGLHTTSGEQEPA